MPKVSVIVPSFNLGKYIAQTIESVLNQTFQDFEIIITDDGSIDNSVSEIKKFKDERIKLFQLEKNSGFAYALNHSIPKSNGEYIALLSADDIFLPEKLQKQVDFLDNNPSIGAVFSLAELTNDKGVSITNKGILYQSIFNQPNRDRYRWLNHFFYYGNCLCHPSAVIRRSCIEDVGMYENNYLQLADFDMWVRLCMKYDIHIIEEKLVHFRIRDSEANASGNRPDARMRGDWEYYNILKLFFAIDNIDTCLKIFPELNDNYSNFIPHLIPFYVAMLSLKVDNAIYKLAALETLSNLLHLYPNELENMLGFTPIDFITLTGKYDLFGKETLRSRDKKWSAKFLRAVKL